MHMRHRICEALAFARYTKPYMSLVSRVDSYDEERASTANMLRDQ